MRAAILAMICFAAFAGCTGTETTSSTSAAPKTVSETFETNLNGVIPAGWTIQNGVWSLVKNDTARSGSSVLKGVGAADPGFSALLATGSWDDLELALDFVMVSGGGGKIGDIPQGAGAIIHRSGDKDFQIIRYSATELSWNLFTVKDGTRNKQTAATVEGGTHPAFGQWVHMTVSSQGGMVTVKDGSTTVLSYQVPEGHSRSGSAGPFVRGDTIAYFDDVKIQ
ncbi:MAG TPA: hypothetical protein VM286_09330 [Candidatus Thermoplasmatota archaeon]|nr:hypothetical protein [Candidatus Thermoplasmatota archaeon]